MSSCCASTTAATRTRESSCRITSATASGLPSSTRRRLPTDSPSGGAGPLRARQKVGCSETVGTDSWPTTKAWRPGGCGAATPSAGAVRYRGVGLKRKGGEGGGGLKKGERGVGRFLFPSTLPTCSSASRRAPSRPTPTLRSWVTPSPSRRYPKRLLQTGP